jgi:hypothetical protein
LVGYLILIAFGLASSATGMKISNNPFSNLASTLFKSNLGAILYPKLKDFLDKP